MTGPPWIHKIVYDDGEVEVVYTILGPWQDMFYASYKREPIWFARGRTLSSALLQAWLRSKGARIPTRDTRRKP